MSLARPMTTTMATVPTLANDNSPQSQSNFLDSHVQGFDQLVLQCVYVAPFIADVTP